MTMNKIKKSIVGFMISALIPMILMSCTYKEGEEDYPIVFNDLQNITYITKYIDQNLLVFFGEENINFGDTPPNIVSEFVANKNIYDTAVSVITWGDHDTTLVGYPPSGLPQATDFYHKFYEQDGGLSKYICMTIDKTTGDTIVRHVDTIFIIGHDSLFTAYYHETTSDPGTPTNQIIISGRKTANGIADYKYGIKIIKHENPELVNGFKAGTLFVFTQKDNALAPYYDWYDDSQLSQGVGISMFDLPHSPVNKKQ